MEVAGCIGARPNDMDSVPVVDRNDWPTAFSAVRRRDCTDVIVAAVAFVVFRMNFDCHTCRAAVDSYLSAVNWRKCLCSLRIRVALVEAVCSVYMSNCYRASE